MLSAREKTNPPPPQIDRCAPPPERPFSLAASGLRDTGRRDGLLAVWAGRIGTQEIPVAASMLAKRYASRLIAQGLRDLSVRNATPDWSAENVRIRLESGWELFLEPVDGTVRSCPAGERTAWREAAIRRFFAGNLSPVLDSLSVHVPAAILWESTRIYLHHFYETWLREAETPADRERIREDLFRLTSPDFPLSGDGRPNPLAAGFRSIPHPSKPDQELRLRQTCCLYHRLPGAAPCINCPRLQKPACESGKALLRSRP